MSLGKEMRFGGGCLIIDLESTEALLMKLPSEIDLVFITYY